LSPSLGTCFGSSDPLTMTKRRKSAQLRQVCATEVL
jgi:hypothetical protein